MALLLMFLLFWTTNWIHCLDLKEFCDRVQCEPVSCKDEEGYIKEAIGECCPGCVNLNRVLDEKEECMHVSEWKTLFQNDPYVSLDYCQPGLICSRKGKCQNADNDCFRKIKNQEQISSDQWIPNCKVTGEYNGRQCSRGVCYCVDNVGVKVFGRSDYFSAENMTCVCSLKAKQMSEAYLSCETNGDFAPIQCLHNLCFCVNISTGFIIAGQILPKTLVQFLPCYNEELFNRYIASPCIIERNRLQTLRDYFSDIGFDVNSLSGISCDPDGTFAPKQCDAHKCRCVKPNGETSLEIEVSNDEIRKKMDCQCNRENWELQNEERPANIKCLTNGNYEEVGFSKDGEKCFCQNNMGFQVTLSVLIKDIETNICDENFNPEEDESPTYSCYRIYRQLDC